MEQTQTAAIRIEGMSCGGCVRSVERALAACSGVKVREVEVGRAEIEAVDEPAVAGAIAAIEDAGFDAARA